MVTPLTEAPPRVELDSERQVLGAILASPTALEEVRPSLTSDDFWRSAHSSIYAACLAVADAGHAPEPVIVFERLRSDGDLERAGGALYLHGLMAELVTATNVLYHAARVRDVARLRRVDQHAQRIRQIVAEAGDDLDVAMLAVMRELIHAETVAEDPGSQPVPDVQTWNAFIDARPPDESRWIVPGLIRRHDTIMILGAAGAGKSFLSRQLAMCLAAGLHPFTLKSVTPVRTLLVDLENAPDQVAEESTGLRLGVRRLGGDSADRGWIWPHPEGFDLRKPADAALLERVVAQVEPDVLCMGSLYNAYRRGRDDWDTAAEDVQAVLKRLRTRYGLGLWLEHHMPRKEGSGHTGTPYGGTAWEKWPTHGRVLRRLTDKMPLFGLEATFRGDRGERDLPVALMRGGKLPLTAIFEEAEVDMYLQGNEVKS